MADVVLRDPFNFDMRPNPLNLSRVFKDFPTTEESAAVDIAEVDGDIRVEVSLPGYGREEIDVGLGHGVLTIDAHHKDEHGEKKANYYRRERRSGIISRRVGLPAAIADDAKIDAELKNGVLTLTIPRAAQPKEKRIEVKAA